MVEVRRRGSAGIVICSEPFVQLGRTQSRVLGVPDLPLVVIKHPLGGLTLSDVRARAAQALPEVLALARAEAAS